MTLTEFLKDKIRDWLFKGIPDIYGSKSLPSMGPGVMGRKGDKKAQLEEYHSWVYACVNARASEVMMAERQVFTKNKANELTQVSISHPLVSLLADPNEYFTAQEIWYVSQVHLDLTGDAFWYTPRNGLGVPAEIWVLPVDRVRIIPSKEDDFVSHYELQSSMGKSYRFEKEEVVHLRYPNPVDPFYGFSVLSAAAYAADINTYQHKYQRYFYQNYGVPDFAVTVPGTLDEQTFTRLKDELKEKYSGPDKRGLPMLLEGGATMGRVGVSPKEINWLADNKATMQEVCGIYRVPPSKIGQEDVPNRAVAEASDYSFSKNVIEPILTMMDERLTQDLARDFDETLVIRHVSTVKGDLEQKARIREINLRAGFTARNEERAKEGLEPVDGGDEILIPTNYVPLSSIGGDDGEDESMKRVEASLTAKIAELKALMETKKNGESESLREIVRDLEGRLDAMKPEQSINLKTEVTLNGEALGREMGEAIGEAINKPRKSFAKALRDEEGRLVGTETITETP